MGGGLPSSGPIFDYFKSLNRKTMAIGFRGGFSRSIYPALIWSSHPKFGGSGRLKLKKPDSRKMGGGLPSFGLIFDYLKSLNRKTMAIGF